MRAELAPRRGRGALESGSHLLPLCPLGGSAGLWPPAALWNPRAQQKPQRWPGPQPACGVLPTCPGRTSLRAGAADALPGRGWWLAALPCSAFPFTLPAQCASPPLTSGAIKGAGLRIFAVTRELPHAGEAVPPAGGRQALSQLHPPRTGNSGSQLGSRGPGSRLHFSLLPLLSCPCGA